MSRSLSSFLLVAAVAHLCVAAAAFAQVAPATLPAGVENTTVFRAGDDGVPQYRIPAAVVTPRGTLLVFAEARTNVRGAQSDAGHIAIVLRRSTDGGATFGPAQRVLDDGANTFGNPCAVVDARAGRVVLVACHNPARHMDKTATAAERGERTVWVTHSDDDGATWSPPREITADVKRPNWTWYATGPGVGIQLARGPHAGRLVVPCNHSAPNTPGGRSHVIYSDDGGATWRLGGAPTTTRGNESQVVEAADGALLLNMRHSAQPKDQPMPTSRGVARSDDGGETFGPESLDDALPDPRCQASILRYAWPDPATGTPGAMLFSNPASTERREALTVRMSADDAKTWSASRLLWPGFAGYSCLARLADGRVAVAYEAGDAKLYERIDVARFPIGWIAE